MMTFTGTLWTSWTLSEWTDLLSVFLLVAAPDWVDIMDFVLLVEAKRSTLTLATCPKRNIYLRPQRSHFTSWMRSEGSCWLVYRAVNHETASDVNCGDKEVQTVVGMKQIIILYK